MAPLSKRIALVAGTTVILAGVWSATGRERVSAVADPSRTIAAQHTREVRIPAGTRLRIRLASSYSSASSRVEDRVDGTLESDVRADRMIALPKGSRINGVVSSVERPGKVKGRGRIGLRLTEIVLDGETYPIYATYVRVAPATKGEDAKKIGIPAAGGAIVGGLIGGKKGALAGAAVGGGAGTAVVLSSRGKDATIGGGSIIWVTLRRALTVRVPIR